jgi:glyoxylase-like metal-dependent hydrolase (beta-lactamase superfamily II)
LFIFPEPATHDVKPTVRHFHYKPTGSLAYVVSDPDTRRAAVIDPVLGFSIVSGRTDTACAQEIVDYVRAESLTVDWILETHAHADHLSAASFIRNEVGGCLGIGRGIGTVQAHFAGIFNLGPPFEADGCQFDRLFADGEVIEIGGLECRVIETPGHTSDGTTLLIGDAAFVGDTLFMPDLGTARCDFPGGNAGQLFDSIRKLYTLSADTRLFVCHDYPPEGRQLRVAVTVAEQKVDNVHLRSGSSRADFVTLREKRDATLSLPALILPALQVNIRAGHLPPAEDNGVSYLKIPLDLF